MSRHKENLSDDKKLRGKTKARVEQGVNVERRSKFRNDPQFNIVDDDFVEDSLKAAKKGSKQRQVMLKDTKGNNVNSNASKKRTKSDFQESSDEGQNKKKKKLKKRIQDMRNKMKEQVLAAQVQNETKKDGNRKQKAAIGLKDDEEVVKKVRDYEGYIQRKFTPEVFSEMVAGLNKKQKEWVVRTGFGGLLQFQMQHYPHRLGYKIAESFDRKRCCLKLIDGDVEISPLIVSKVLGSLPFLIYLYVDRVKNNTTRDVERSIPAYIAWSDGLLRERQKNELNGNCFGVGEILKLDDKTEKLQRNDEAKLVFNGVTFSLTTDGVSMDGNECDQRKNVTEEQDNRAILHDELFDSTNDEV
ncbi:hypothetical protein POM88_032032 [Heracleum sosnowskyi]|uniref:Uncharacterized protein n=1 Tax=Heracleum sosnowskyi TaxID=360622 RepID=A0AAD8HZR7_9APIA|nr:hypothetical protein POM88_032032 [Heracleum sosnowskyi]